MIFFFQVAFEFALTSLASRNSSITRALCKERDVGLKQLQNRYRTQMHNNSSIS